MKVKSESEVTQSYLTLSNPMDCSPPGSSIHGTFQARVLEWALPSPFIGSVIDFSERKPAQSNKDPAQPKYEK